MLKDPVPLHDVRRALVVKLRHHGDVLLTSPVFSVLKAAVPQIEIDALVYADTAPMLEGHPAIARLHVIDRNWKRQGALAQLSAEWSLLQSLRQRNIDLLVHLTEHPRGAWLARLLKPRWSVAPRTGRSGMWAKSFTHFYPRANHPLRHTVESNLDALRRIGVQPALDGRRLQLVPGPTAEAEIALLLAQHGLRAGQFLLLHPASRWQFKCWTAAGWAGLIDRANAAGWRIVISGAPDAHERALVDAILEHTSVPLVDLCGQLSLKALAALAASARAFAGVDSAPMHIACAMGTPTLALFGPSGDIEWGPWGVPHRIVKSGRHPCRPCGLDGCGGGKISECLTTLRVDDVWAELVSLLDETGGACASR